MVGDDDDVAVVRDERAPRDLRRHELAVEDVLELADEALGGLLELGRQAHLVARAALDGRGLRAGRELRVGALVEILDVLDAAARLERPGVDDAAADLEGLEELGEHERVEAEIALERELRADLARGPPRHSRDRDAHGAELARGVLGGRRRRDEALEDPADLLALDLARGGTRQRRVVEVNDRGLLVVGE